MRAAPAFRERLSDFEAVSTGSFSNHGEYINDRSHEPCRPGKAQPPPGIKAAPYPLSSPGGAVLTGPTRCEPVRGPCRPGKAQPPPGGITVQASISLCILRLAGLQLLCYFRTDCAPG
ncbi:hypothetical protein D0Y48_15710 [Klebsiella quasipneumoniae]|nr:hypothetical protein [Klebsiella quasipneumoniae]